MAELVPPAQPERIPSIKNFFSRRKSVKSNSEVVSRTETSNSPVAAIEVPFESIFLNDF
jgi:hypothetical protein